MKLNDSNGVETIRFVHFKRIHTHCNTYEHFKLLKESNESFLTFEKVLPSEV